MGIKDSFRLVAKNLTSLNKSYTNTTTRPSIAQPYMSTDTGAKLPIFPFPLIMIYELADNIDAIRIPIETLNREMFKNGFEVIEKFKFKCSNCSKEFQYKPLKNDNPDEQPFEQNQDNETGQIPRSEAKKGIPNEMNTSKEMECDSCGNTNMLRPVPENRKKLEDLLENPINGNDQTLEDVARQLERDLEIADNAYCLVLKSYDIDDVTGKINHETSEIKEFLRIDPPQVAMIADSDGRIGYDDKRNKIFVCPRFEHRDKRLTEPKCDRCGAEALKAVVEVNSVYSVGIPQPKRVVYGEGEVIWKAGKYKPSLIYGYSPIYSIWSKAMSLSHMDEYIRKYFDKMRPPRGMLVIASRNYETFRKSWDVLEQKATEDPYMIHPLLVESDKGGKNLAQWIDFTGSLKELEFTVIRKELRQIIGAVFGVLPLYYGELPSGWSQEGLQVTITNRAVKWGQDVLYKSFLQKIARLIGVEDWELRLKGGEENDKLRDLQIQGVEIQNMAAMQAMGFEVTRSHTGEFKVSKNPLLSPEAMILGVPDESKPNTSGSKGRGRGTAAPKEDQQKIDGKPKKQRPSDIGGVGQGHPASGKGTSQSNKMYLEPKKYPDGINSMNFEMVKKTLQDSIDFDWTKKKTVEELRSKSFMTVRHARDIVKAELAETKRWEDEDF